MSSLGKTVREDEPGRAAKETGHLEAPCCPSTYIDTPSRQTAVNLYTLDFLPMGLSMTCL
jgi:hypothetical protein